MAEHTAIEWADATFNPWVGCTKVSSACDGCYAEAWAKRTGHPELWHGGRRITTPAYWRAPLKWNREAAADGVRRRVFCASLADVFDNQVPEGWRTELWSLIDAAWHLDWLLLTKRPQNIAKMLPVMDSNLLGYRPWKLPWPWPHVWLGTTVENQEEADRRVPVLLETPAAKRFLSCEPLLGPVDLTPKADRTYQWLSQWYGPSGFDPTGSQPLRARVLGYFPRIDWVICGGESGPKARPMHPDWARGLRDQCAGAGVPFFFKQWGEWGPPGLVDPGMRSVEWGAMLRLGKKRAGRLLDGREHSDVPA